MASNVLLRLQMFVLLNIMLFVLDVTSNAILGNECTSSVRASAAPPAGLGTCSQGRGLPTLGCLLEALPNMEEVLRPTGVWQKRCLELIAFSEARHE